MRQTWQVFGIFAFGACNSAQASDCPVMASLDQIASTLGREQASGETGQIFLEDNGNIKTVFFTKNNGRAIFEGDIVIGKLSDIEPFLQGTPLKIENTNSFQPFGLIYKRVLSGAAKWKNAVVPYQIDASAPNQSAIHRAVKTWVDETGLKFVERTSFNAAAYNNYIIFKKGSDSAACYSETLGMKGGEQYIELVPGCEYGQILHEIGHALGLDHEQNRSDRSDYVTVNFSNIWPQYTSAFLQEPRTNADVGRYDYDSIMHYEANAFSCNNKPTIVSKNSQPIGQRDHLSKGDISTIKNAYALP